MHTMPLKYLQSMKNCHQSAQLSITTTTSPGDYLQKNSVILLANATRWRAEVGDITSQWGMVYNGETH